MASFSRWFQTALLSQATEPTWEDAMGPEILIALMGATGTGKSTFINKVTEAKQGENWMEEGHRQSSCTAKVACARFVLDGQKVVLIDTPGFNDTNLSDTEILKRIAAFLYVSYGRDIKLSGILYLHDISAKRFGGAAKKNFIMFRELCGWDNLRNVVLVTTMWSNCTSKAAGEKAQRDLADNHWAAVLEKGSRVFAYDNNGKSAQSIIRDVMNNAPAALAIQDEMVANNGDILQTAAGRAINEEILAERLAREQELQDAEEKHRKVQKEMEAVYERQLKATEDKQRALQEQVKTALEKDKAMFQEQINREKIENAKKLDKIKLEQEEMDSEYRQGRADLEAAINKSEAAEEALRSSSQEMQELRQRLQYTASLSEKAARDDVWGMVDMVVSTV